MNDFTGAMADYLPVPSPESAIVVTGKALPDPASAKAFAVDVIGASDLRRSPGPGLDTIIKRVPGLQLFRRSDATSSHPTSQGVTLRALGGNAASRALLVLDGVPQSDPFGGWVNWPAYDAGGLDRVIVIRGGGSVTYGPGALAGVIDMASLSSPSSNASIDIGSRGSVHAHAFGGADVARGLVQIDAQAGRSNGFVPITLETRGAVDRPAPYSEASARLRWVVPLSTDIEAQMSGLAFIDRRDRGVDFTANRTRGADASIRLVGHGPWQWSMTAYAQARNLRSSFASIARDRSSVSRASLQDSVPSRSIGFSAEIRPPVGNGVELRVGTDGRLANGESREFFSYLAGIPTRRRVAGGTAQTEGLFAEASHGTGPLNLSGGLRIDHWRINNGQLVEWSLSNGVRLRDDHYAVRGGWLPTARAAATIGVSSGLSLRAAAYRGWRLPTLNELYRPFRAGADATAANPNLQPETLNGAEAGIDLRRAHFELSLTAFANRLNNAIANVTLGRGPGNFPGVGFVAAAYRQRQNIDAVIVHGVEASAGAHRGPWSARLSTSLTDPRVRASGIAGVLNGLRPAQTPRLTVSGSLGWDNRGRSILIEGRYVGAQFDDDQNARRLRPAFTLDAFGSLPVSREISLVLKAENLFDETVRTGIGDDGSVERATARTLWIGLRVAPRR